jgi:hypothetical protein
MRATAAPGAKTLPGPARLGKMRDPMADKNKPSAKDDDNKAADNKADDKAAAGKDAKADDKDAKGADKDPKGADKDPKGADRDAKDEGKGATPGDSPRKEEAPPPAAAKDAGKTATAEAGGDPDEVPVNDADGYAILVPQKYLDTSVSADAPADPPGVAPPGDSRSFRRKSGGKEEFVLIYRDGSYLITRAGEVGKMGSWTVAGYPDQGSAAHAYAHKCSDLTGEGFVDLR